MPRTFIWCCYHSNRRELKVTGTPWQGSELMWKSFTDICFQGTLCSLAAQLPSLVIAYTGVGGFCSWSVSQSVFWRIWGHRTSSWQRSSEQSHPLTRSAAAASETGKQRRDRESPAWWSGNMAEEKKQTANGKSTCRTWAIPARCATWVLSIA